MPCLGPCLSQHQPSRASSAQEQAQIIQQGCCLPEALAITTDLIQAVMIWALYIRAVHADQQGISVELAHMHS